MSVNMNVFTTRRDPAVPVGGLQAGTSPTCSTVIAAVGHASAASRMISSPTLSTSTTADLAKSPASQSKAVGLIVDRGDHPREDAATNARQ